MIKETAALARDLQQCQYAALEEMLRFTSERAPSDLRAAVRGALAGKGASPLEEHLVGSLFPEFFERQISAWAVMSVCSIFERSMTLLSEEVRKVRPNTSTLTLDAFGGEKLAKFMAFFADLHKLPFMRDDEEAVVRYLYMLRHIYIHNNGELPESDGKVKGALSNIKDRELREKLQYVVSSDKCVSLPMAAAITFVTAIGEIDREVTTRIATVDPLSRKRGSHHIASDSSDIAL